MNKKSWYSFLIHQLTLLRPLPITDMKYLKFHSWQTWSASEEFWPKKYNLIRIALTIHNIKLQILQFYKTPTLFVIFFSYDLKKSRRQKGQYVWLRSKIYFLSRVPFDWPIRTKKYLLLIGQSNAISFRSSNATTKILDWSIISSRRKLEWIVGIT